MFFYCLDLHSIWHSIIKNLAKNNFWHFKYAMKMTVTYFGEKIDWKQKMWNRQNKKTTNNLNRKAFSAASQRCLRYRTTLRFDLLHFTFAQTSAFLCILIHRIMKFQDFQLCMHINSTPNGKQKWSWDRINDFFVDEKQKFAHRP